MDTAKNSQWFKWNDKLYSLAFGQGQNEALGVYSTDLTGFAVALGVLDDVQAMIKNGELPLATQEELAAHPILRGFLVDAVHEKYKNMDFEDGKPVAEIPALVALQAQASTEEA